MGETRLPPTRSARSPLQWAYLFGAVCPERSTGAAIIMPEVNIEAMNEHLAEISRRVSAGAIALLVLDGAGWHSSPRLTIPDNIALLPLPPYAPELNPVENVWEFLRANLLSHRVWDTYEAILEACCDAWNKLMATPERIASITRRAWANGPNRSPDRPVGMISFFMALLSFVDSHPEPTQAQGGQRQPPYFNNGRDIPRLATPAQWPHKRQSTLGSMETRL